MEFNEIFKKFMETAIGLGTTAAEKMFDFAETMAEKGKAFKEEKKPEIEEFIKNWKSKFQETTENLLKTLKIKDERIDNLEKKVAELEKQVEDLKNKIK
ncbi:MAG TPA: hypothetical protein PKW55_04625 [Spirochaetota bacterium]|nr:hypothetical protein [Spirochaetota bacterium]HOM37877.1 hypothetical protein [Spirochaetota bacterium]HPQ48681.1 hypothetical protein [Spirochaetota bacterium]